MRFITRTSVRTVGKPWSATRKQVRQDRNAITVAKRLLRELGREESVAALTVIVKPRDE